MKMRDKKARSRPEIIAPVKLVAANVIPNRIIAIRMVPRMPASKTGSIEQVQLRAFLPLVKRSIARYTTAIPKTTHKNAGVIVIAAVIVRNAVIIPIIRLDTIAIPVQLLLQLQPKFDILSPPTVSICLKNKKVSKCQKLIFGG